MYVRAHVPTVARTEEDAWRVGHPELGCMEYGTVLLIEHFEQVSPTSLLL